MNFNSINRFNFTPIEKIEFSGRRDETIRMSKTAVTITKALFERMGKPELVSFGYDAEEKALGMKVTDKSDPNALAVNIRTTGTPQVKHSVFVSNLIAKEMKVDLNERSILMKRGYKIDDYFVFELRYAEALKKSTKKVTR